MKILYWILIAVLLILAGDFLFFYLSLTSIEVSNFKIEGLSINSDGFNFNGFIEVDNPGFVNVDIEQIDYSLLFEYNNQTIGSGSIPGKKLPSRSKTNIDFDETIEWKPTLGIMLDLIKKDKVYVKISGKIRSNYGDSEFETKINIKSMINSYAKSLMKNLF